VRAVSCSAPDTSSAISAVPAVAALGVVEERRHEQRDQREDHQARLQADALGIELELALAGASDDDREAEAEERIADDRAGDLRLDDVRVPFEQHEDREHELGGVAERRVQQAADRRTGPVRDLPGAAANPFGERDDRRDAEHERPERPGTEQVVRAERDRHEHEQSRPHHPAAVPVSRWRFEPRRARKVPRDDFSTTSGE
jgi:hypothetical protein